MSNSDAPAHKLFKGLSNPLDWPHIDRMILLALLVMSGPLWMGFGIALLWWLQPSQLVMPVATGLLLFLFAHALALAGFIGAACYKRRKQHQWALMENFVIFSFLASTLIAAWLSGTQFSAGVLLLLLGVNLASPLASIHRLKHAYFFGCALFISFFILAAGHFFPHAPLFASSPLNPDGSPKTYWLVFEMVLVAVTLGILYIGLISTERWGNRESLYREMSSVDGLTRLTNRRSFIERGQTEFNRALHSPSAKLSCIMIDIDHFKQVNDTHGHQAGDAVLVEVSRILMDNARQYDEVGRYGGEEFAILLPRTPLEAALRVAERLRSHIEANSVTVDGMDLTVTASFGVACYPSDAITDMASLLKAADMALYDAKHQGRNRVVAASPHPAQTAGV